LQTIFVPTFVEKIIAKSWIFDK